MLVEIHMLQNHAPSNLNRDDTGSPKECFFGGALRARISSQCLKRSIRRSPVFEARLKGHLGTRTRRLPQLLKDELRRLGCSEEACEAIARKATTIGSGKESQDGETRQLIFLDPAEVAPLARDLKNLYDRVGAKAFADLKIDDLEKQVARQLPRSVDIALFGRMTTTTIFEDVQASVQVAHAVSTGKVEKQFDYFTAVDDLVGRASAEGGADEQGAGMIGDVEFNSATYYKYFSVHWEQLVQNLGGDEETARQTLAAFLLAAALTTPTGKQNTFAAHNPPDLILVEVKADQVPISYANAFLNPVRPDRDRDVMEKSVEALSAYVTRLKSAYGDSVKSLASLCLIVRGSVVAGSDPVATLEELVERTLAAIPSGQPAEA